MHAIFWITNGWDYHDTIFQPCRTGVNDLKAIPNLMPTKNVTLNYLNFKVSNCTDRNVFLTSLAILLVTSLGPLHVTRTPRLWLFLTSNDRGSIKVTADLNYLVPVSFEFTHLEKIALAVNSDYPEPPKKSQKQHTNTHERDV